MITINTPDFVFQVQNSIQDKSVSTDQNMTLQVSKSNETTIYSLQFDLSYNCNKVCISVEPHRNQNNVQHEKHTHRRYTQVVCKNPLCNHPRCKAFRETQFRHHHDERPLSERF